MNSIGTKWLLNGHIKDPEKRTWLLSINRVQLLNRIRQLLTTQSCHLIERTLNFDGYTFQVGIVKKTQIVTASNNAVEYETGYSGTKHMRKYY